jgi:hypothetical protein
VNNGGVVVTADVVILPDRLALGPRQHVVPVGHILHRWPDAFSYRLDCSCFNLPA